MGVLKKMMSLTGFAPGWWPAEGTTDIDLRAVSRDWDETVNASSAMGLSAVWACSNLIAGTISTLPLQVYRPVGTQYQEVDRAHPLYRVLHDAPNFDQTAVDLLGYLSLSLDLHGNAFAEVERDGDRVIALTPIRPDIVHVRRDQSGDLTYTWTDRGKRREARQDRVLHVRGPGGDAEGGLSVLTFARQTFGAAQAAERVSARLFRGGARPSGIISTKDQLSKEQRGTLRDLLQKDYRQSMEAGLPLIMDNGMSFSAISLSSDDAQMLESRQFSVEEICRFFGVPPVMIGHTSKTTSWPSGVEQQVLLFVKFTLRQRLKRIEQAMMRQLLTDADRARGVTIEFNLEGLLRGDSAGRAAFYQAGLQNGWLTINEVRARENLKPVDGGDVPRMQMQNIPITETPDRAETTTEGSDAGDPEV